MQVALNGQRYSPAQHFTYFAGPISVGTVYPPLGPTSGGTEVTVTSGSWVPFVDTGSVSCYIYKLEITNQGRNMMRGPVRPTLLHRGLFEDELEVCSFSTIIETPCAIIFLSRYFSMKSHPFAAFCATRSTSPFVSSRSRLNADHVCSTGR